MPDIPHLKFVQDFLEKFSDLRLFSTGFEVIDFSDDLYNVRGSTGDPIPGPSDSWKELLEDESGLSGADCYVTNVPPPDNSTSHPSFSVGGHMTTNSDGSVPIGSECYLMPLCSWHNHHTRTDRFTHSETRMLKLIGYMEAEPFATFSLRLPSPQPFAMLYFDQADGTWKHKNISREQSRDVDRRLFGRASKAEQCKHRVLFERAEDSPLLLSVKEVELPK